MLMKNKEKMSTDLLCSFMESASNSDLLDLADCRFLERSSDP
jgi:hypothetical protein